MALKSGYTIGITIFVNANGELGLFENGLRQNVFFLYRLLPRLAELPPRLPAEPRRRRTT